MAEEPGIQTPSSRARGNDGGDMGRCHGADILDRVAEMRPDLLIKQVQHE